MPRIVAATQDGIGTITLAHPEKRNILGAPLITETLAALDSFRREGVRAVILRATPGAKVWSAGHDVAELPPSGRDPRAWGDPLEQLVRAVRELPAPVLAMIEGTVWGGGCELAFACDLILATPEVTFALTPARLGVPPNVAGLLRLANVLGLPLLRELLFTARPVSAGRLLATGVVHRLVSAAELEVAARETARGIAQLSPRSIAVIKEQLRLLADARPLPPEVFERIQSLRRQVYDSEDYQEGRRAFLEKRPPVFR
ncbi:MAG: methylmalonyl-CoA decarboxylase [Deltaproteobacteria bacterium]|nr:methylmalonyl-CoA decarboxylase [Deltaproteobacteria bacterium]